jgi:hypothetical protein
MEKPFFRLWNSISTPINLDEFRKLALIGKIRYDGIEGVENTLHTLRSVTLTKAYWILEIS